MPRTVESAAFWNKVARQYARAPIKDMTGYQRTLDRTARLLRSTDTVLEIGCGTGMSALQLAPNVGRLIASDVASEMIAIARDKQAAAGTAENVSFVVAGADDVVGTDASIDAVLAFNMLHLASDATAVLAGAHRALKPGGLLISKTPCLTEMNFLIRRAIPPLRRVGLAPPVSVFSASQLETMIEAQGFDIIERERHGATRRDFRIFIVARKRADSHQPDSIRRAARP